MFAGVWQLLTALFIVSALVKLVYKLIKEEKSPHQFWLERQQAELAGAEQQQQQQQLVAETHSLGWQDEQSFMRSYSQDENVRSDDEHEEDQIGQLQANFANKLESDERPAGEFELYERDHSNENEDYDDYESENERQDEFDWRKENRLQQRVERSCNFTAQANEQNEAKQQDAIGHRKASASELYLGPVALFADSILVEPCKFLLQVFDGSIKLFWSILDSIEGIELQGEREEEEEEERQQVSSRPSGSPRPERGRWRGSNYFHRRYTSRRSLSAALLDDLEVGGGESRVDFESLESREECCWRLQLERRRRLEELEGG